VALSADRIDVLFLTHNFPRHSADFAGRFLARLACLIQEQGPRVGVLAPHHPGASTEETIDDIRVWRFRYASDAAEQIAYRGEWGGLPLFGPRGIWAHGRFLRCFHSAAKDLVEQYRPSVIHAHWWVPGGWVARRFATGRRLAVTLHGADLRLLQRKRWLRPLAARVFARADIITTVSSPLARALSDWFPHSAHKLQVAPMPADDSIFSPLPGVKTTNDPPLIICVTRFTAQKRNDVLLKALDLLRRREVRFHARLIGEGGDLKPQIQRQISASGLGAMVELVGSMDQRALADVYRRADVVVLPAVDEGFGMVLVEAQLCGCAVVGVTSGGITDIISPEASGLLARPDDPESLAEVLARVLADHELRERLTGGGLAWAREKFSSAAIVDRFLTWYGWRG